MKKEPILREKLEKIYKENTTSIAAKQLGISVPSLYSYLEEFKIPLKGRGGKKNRRKLWIIE